MISVVICSRDERALEQIVDSIKATIGTPYEIQSIDNSQGKYGICEAYNIAAERSLYNILCFVHEDVRFHTHNWGHKVLDLLKDNSIGLIGVAGGQTKTKTPGSWWNPYTHKRVNILQGLSTYNSTVIDQYNPLNEKISDVVVLDGVWLCCRKEIWSENRFDNHTLREFHFYDLDFSMQVFQKGYRVCVVYDILIEHFSLGAINRSWVNAAILFSKKWNKRLPVSINNLNDYQQKKIEFESCREFLRILISLNIKSKAFYYYCLVYLFSDSRGWSLKKLIKEKIRFLL